MSALASKVLALDATLHEDDGQALAVELPARSWRELDALRDLRAVTP